MTTGKRPKRIIFVCVGNSCRSQMAESLARHHAKNLAIDVEISSAGTRPEGYVHPAAILVMKAKGVDISSQHSKGIKPEELLGYDCLITMGCSDKGVCPLNFRGDVRNWDIDDPFGKPIESYRQVRDQIEEKVICLLEEIR